MTHSFKTLSRTAFACAALAFLGACATTSDPASTDEVQQVAMKDDAVAVASSDEGLDMNEEVCKRQKQATSRFTKKICFTRQQWKDMAEDARRGTAQTQQRAFDTGRGS